MGYWEEKEQDTSRGKWEKNGWQRKDCMSIMIFNVNIYRTWKKNRILKIKWNKYNMIQISTMSLRRYSWKLLYIFLSFFFLFLNSAAPWAEVALPRVPRVSAVTLIQQAPDLWTSLSFLKVQIFFSSFFCLIHDTEGKLKVDNNQKRNWKNITAERGLRWGREKKITNKTKAKYYFKKSSLPSWFASECVLRGDWGWGF